MKVDRELFRDLGGLRLAAHELATGLRQGDRRSPYRGRGMEFADYRPYSPGDDLRLVDWNVYERLQMVLVRLFHEDRNLSVQICVDASASMAFGAPRKADHAAELGACLALVALLTRDSVTVGCCGGDGTQLKVRGHNSKAFPAVLRLLERVEPGGASDPVRALEGQLDGSRADRFLFLSDLLFEEEALERVLRLLAAASRRPVLLHVLSEEELAPDLSGPQKVVDAETGEEVLIRGGRQAEADYAAWLDGWLERLRERCRALRIQYVPAWTTAPVRELLHLDLRRRRVVESARGGAS